MPQRFLRTVRVLDFGEVFAGPYATTLLADAGADVIKIESIQRMPAVVRGDRFPRAPTFGYVGNDPGERPWERFFFFHCVERNKRGITLDLGSTAGRALFEQLLCITDIVISNYAGGVLERLGYDYDRLRALRPDIILIYLSGFGDSGPYRRYVSFAPVTEALSGQFALRGYPETAPADTPHTLWSDGVAATMAALLALAALRFRARTGRGQYIDLSQAEASTLFCGPAILDYVMNGRVPGATGNAEPGYAPSNTYPCAPDGAPSNADDRWVAIAARTDAEWVALCHAMGRPDLIDDPRFCSAAERKRNEAALDAEIAAWTRGLTRHEAARLLLERGVPAAPVLDDADVERDPQIAARRLIQRVYHADAGEQPYVTGAWQVAGEQPWIARPPNRLGEHNHEVLMDLLGVDAERFAALSAANIIGEAYLPEAGRG